MKKWQIKSQSLKKFYLKHPWIFSNELNHSPKNVTAGELVDLHNEAGDFLARGYSHPNTLICFRILSRDNNEKIDRDFFCGRYERAYLKRTLADVNACSFRFIFAEADYLPGLIIDRFKLVGESQVFVMQSSTAGMDLLLTHAIEGLEKFVKQSMSIPWEQTAIILANDSKSRILEGIAAEPKKLYKDLQNVDWNEIEIEIAAALPSLPKLKMTSDLLGGQKTGFFLDQRSNVEMLLRACQRKWSKAHRGLRVLDLCCYNGQWSAQLANLFASQGIECEFTCVDASDKALQMAKKNIQKFGIKEGLVRLEKLDVLKDLAKLADQSYDIVICDPPAFIKKKQDIPNGERAYVKLNRDAIKKTKMDGLFISCSCSGHLDDLKFREVLIQAAGKSGRNIEWLWRGTHSPDHPELAEFPQGTYLKSWLGWMK